MWTYRTFQFSRFEYLKHIFDWQRNNYDKLGHFVQGFFPAFIARELVIKKEVFAKKSLDPSVRYGNGRIDYCDL